MAATEKVVNQALVGAWDQVPRTLEQRRELLDQLRAQHALGDTPWLQALQQAVRESDAAVQAIAPAAPDAGLPSNSADSLHVALRQSLITSQIKAG